MVTVSHLTDIKSMSKTHMIQLLYQLTDSVDSTITPVQRSCSRRALRHPTFYLSRKLSVVGDSLPRGLNWPIKALSTFRGLAHPPWTT